MRRGIALLALLAPAAAAQDLLADLDPLRDVRPGERCEYRWTSEVGLKKLFPLSEGQETRTVVEVGEAEVALEVARGGSTERKVLDRRLELGKSLLAALPDFQLLIGDAGKLSDLVLAKSDALAETIEAGGAERACWKVTYVYTGRYEFTVKDEPYDVGAQVESTVWVDPDAPIQGVVRRQVTIRAKSLPFDPEVFRWTSTLTACSFPE